jgi:deoxycytidylate deaminase
VSNRVKVFKDFTLSLVSLSKCTERGVAAIITDGEMTQVHSIGINGGPKRLVDCMCITEGKYGCIHAETNCLIKNRYEGHDKIMFITLAPCKQCAAAIINAPGGFNTVYYIEDWKENEGIKLLRAAGIQVVKI